MSTLHRLWQERNVLRLLVKRDLRVRYSQSIIGYVWTVLDPLANAMVYFLLFVVIFERKDAGFHPYFLFLVCGLLPWQWFNAVVNESMRALIAERQLIRSTQLPREIWVIRVVASKGLEFIYSLPVLALFVLIYVMRGETRLDWGLLLFPAAIVLEFVLLVGIGLLLAPLTVMMFDIQPTVRIILRLYFYVTPVIFSLDLLEHAKKLHSVHWLFHINPLSGILELYRAGFHAGPLRWHVIGYSVIGTVIVLLLGIYTFKRMERSVLKEI